MLVYRSMARASRSILGTLASLLLALEVCASPAPQPRVKLQRDADGIASVVAEKTASPADATTVLEKMTVTDSKIPAPPRPLQEYAGKYFSIRKGGPFHERSGKHFSASFGLWHHRDEFAEDARFKAGVTHATFDLLRIKW